MNFVPEVGIVPHQVPQNGPRPNRDERFGDRVRMFSEARAKPPAKQHDFQ
jgi:hypothetical protein